MIVVFRNKKDYLRGKVTVSPGKTSDTSMPIHKAVDFWDRTFGVDYFSFRKKLRRASYDILKSQKAIEKIHLYYNHKELLNPKHLNKIYAPMDDDDIFLISEEEYETCVSQINEKYNSVITGYYIHTYEKNGNVVYGKNPSSWRVHTNNLIIKYDKRPSGRPGDQVVPIDHVPASRSYLVKPTEMKHIETSVHLNHPCSIGTLHAFPKLHPGRKLISTTSDTQRAEILMTHIDEFINETLYREKLPSKFWTHIETFKNIYSELKLK